MARACFAAGCFWGVQYYFDEVPGVTGTTAGYTGGRTVDPTYEQVCTGQTGHAEAVLVEFDPEQVSYETLCRHFFRLHDPTQLNRQGPDVGEQYRSAIFYTNAAQAHIAKQLITELAGKSQLPIVTAIEPLQSFYTAEAYHQHYAARTGRGMCHVSYATL